MTENNPKAIVTKKRHLIAYSEFWHTANMLIKTGESRVKGYGHQFRAALIFHAFTFEAALNHIGAKIFECWDKIERTLSPEKKLALISEKISLKINFGEPPFQNIGHLLRYRNAIAHGKTEILEESYEEEVKEYLSPDVFEFTQSKWEKFATEDNALKVKEDLAEVIKRLYSAAGISDEQPLMTGIQEGGSSLIQ